MNSKILFLYFFTTFTISSSKIIAQVTIEDSLAVIDLYKSTGYHITHSEYSPVGFWEGISIANNRVVKIDLLNKKLKGSLPATLGTLTGLITLSLQGNELSGPIPTSIEKLQKLEQLDLSYNRFSDSISSLPGELPELKYLDLSYNQLKGNIPSSFGNLKNLTYLNLSYNNLSGGIPLSFEKLTMLDQLILNNNQLTSIASINNLLSLKVLNLKVNKLSGNIPASLGNFINMTSLDLGYNNLSGNIPSVLGNLLNLTSLILNDNYLNDTIPSTLSNLTLLEHLDITNNHLRSKIPSSLSNLKNAKGISLSHNYLFGSIPSTLGDLANLKYLDLSFNQLEDSIPSSLGNLSQVVTLNLEHNSLIGNIPPSLGNLSEINYLSLNNNNLTGSIPASLGNNSKMRIITLGTNQLSGTLPATLNNFSQLSFIGIENNALTFAGMEGLIKAYYDYINYKISYSPQKPIPIVKRDSVLSVSVGGSPENITYNWFRNGILISSKGGDSTQKIDIPAVYSVAVTNTAAYWLTLKGSDSIRFKTALVDSTTTVKQNINDTVYIDIMDSMFNKLFKIRPDYSIISGINNALIGTVTIDSSVPTFSNQPYVKRHYDINSVYKVANAKADIVLYFTQEEFDNFNSYVLSHRLNIPLLPVNGTDNGNVRVIQLPGTPAGISNPGNYADTSTVLITPSVTWNDTFHWWEVSFPDTGFGGFYLSTVDFNFDFVIRKLCPTSSDFTISSILKGNHYQWQVNDGNGFLDISNSGHYNGTTDSILSLVNIPSQWYGYQYRCIVDGKVGIKTSLEFSNSWTGSEDSNWENPANWSCGSLPDVNTDVVINSGTVTVHSNVICRSVTLKAGAKCIVEPGFTLTILQ